MRMIPKKLTVGILATSLIALSSASAFAAPQSNVRHLHNKIVRIDSMQRDGGQTGAPHYRAYSPYSTYRRNFFQR